MINKYLSFKICNERYAVNVANVLEVLEKQKITPVPNAPEFILGIINFRGDVVPVFDSRLKFSHPVRDPDSSYVIIVFDLSQKGQNLFLGAMVDKVTDVITVDDKDIKPVPAMSQSFNSEYLEGILKLDDNFVMLINTSKVFTSKEIVELHQTDFV
jgi:purine-binding chemotaxis protein CheW